MPEAEAKMESDWSELRTVLDEELSRLPDRYRAVVILCDVEGRTRKDAARHLRLSGRLGFEQARGAREMLAKRPDAARHYAVDRGHLPGDHATRGRAFDV